LGNLANHVFQLAGPITNMLGEGINKATTLAALKMPERWQLAMVMTMQHIEYKKGAPNPNREPAIVNSNVSTEDAAEILARNTARSSGVKPGKWLENAPGSEFKLKGLFLVERSALGTVSRVPVSAERWNSLMESSVGRAMDANVKGGVIGIIFAAVSLKESFCNPLNANLDQNMNFGSGMATLIGGMVEVGGHILKSAGWAGTNLGIKITSVRLIGFGKGLGTLGGILAGAYDVRQGIKNLDDDSYYGIGMITIGLGEVASAILMVSDVTGPVGMVLGVACAMGIYVIALIKLDDYQKWVENSRFGVNHGTSSGFKNLADQNKALVAMTEKLKKENEKEKEEQGCAPESAG
jgi:hypothetical protein